MMPNTAWAALTPWLAVVAAFGTINEGSLLGQHNEHEMITRAALGCAPGQASNGVCFEPESLDQLAGTHGSIVGAGSNGAVGSPDDLDPVPEGPEAHCDDADYIDIPGYPVTRQQATAQLSACVMHLRSRFLEGAGYAEDLLDDDEIDDDEVDLSPDCVFAFSVNIFGRAKCNVMEGFGRALHGVQDFYSHSNWADQANPALPISDINPPGLLMTSPPSFMDLRATNPDISNQVHTNLSTGCFAGLLSDETPGEGDCEGRVTHNTLNKDHGLINADGTIVGPEPIYPRTVVTANFARAVNGAIAASQAQWTSFRNQLIDQYGSPQASLMICALVRDDPISDCGNRRLAVVVDTSISGTKRDRNLRVQAAVTFNSKLTTDGFTNWTVPDKVAVIHSDTSARVVYPMGEPEKAVFAGIDSGRGTNIGASISVAIDEIMSDQQGDKAARSGILILTDGLEGDPEVVISQLQRAASLNIRVSYGILLPSTSPHSRKRDVAARDLHPQLIIAVLATGGVHATIDAAEAQDNFIDLATARGMTDIDCPDTALVLVPGVSVTDVLRATGGHRVFAYKARAGETVSFVVQDKTSGRTLTAELRDVREATVVGLINAASVGPILSYTADKETVLELTVSDRVGRAGDTLFSVSLVTNRGL